MVARIEQPEMNTTLKGEPKRLKPLWLHRNILEDNIEMGLK
jgi:hypothetical protein